MTKLSARLEFCLQYGNLTVADLSRWFDRPHPTVRGWVANQFKPRGGPHDVMHVYKMLEGLERLIRERQKLPLQRGISRTARIRQIERLRRDIDDRLLQKGITR